MTNMIPQEFEAVLLTSQRYKSGQNFSPTDIWKQITSIKKLQSRPYMSNEIKVKTYLDEAVKSYQLAIEVYNKRGAFKASDITRAFIKAQSLIQDAFTAYAASKQIPATNTNAVNTTPDILTTANEVNNFLSPYYGDISNKVQRYVRFVEKTDTMPTIYAEGIVSCSSRPAQFGNGWEAWVSFKNNPWTIWIIGRTGNSFNTDKDIIDYARQHLPNTRYMGNNILFAREISNWIDQIKAGAPLSGNVAAPATPALASPLMPAPGAALASYMPVKKNLVNNYHLLAQKASAADLIIGRLEKIASNIASIIKADLTAVTYSALSIAIRTFIGLANQLSNLFSRLRGENFYEGDPSKYNFLITQLQKSVSDIGDIYAKNNPDRMMIAKKKEEIGKYIQQIILISQNEYDSYQENMKAKYFLASNPASKSDAGVVLKAYAKGILRASIEILAWTAVNFVVLGFDAVYAGILRLLKLFKQLWMKLRLAMVENGIGSDSNHDKIELYKFQEIQDEIEKSIDDLDQYHGEEYTNDFWRQFQNYVRRLGLIIGRAKTLIEEDILNDESNLDYFDRYIRSYKSSIITISIQKVQVFISNLFKLGKNVLDYFIDSGVGPVFAKFVLRSLITILRILNELIAAGLDLTEDLLLDKDITSHTSKIIEILQRFAPEEVIDKETLSNLKEMFDPIFEKIKFIYSHPKIVIEHIKKRLSNTQNNGMVYRDGSGVSYSPVQPFSERYGNRSAAAASAIASYKNEPLMDSEKIFDETGIGNADNAFGYTPSPVAL